MLRIHIDKQSTILDNLTVAESIDLDTLNELIESNICSDDAEIRIKLLGIRKKLRNGILDVQYKKGKTGYGRIYPSVSLSNMKRIIRHTLTHKNYIDIDIVNCGCQIVNQLCEASGLRNIYLTEYINDREKILNTVMTTYEVVRDSAKELFTALLNGGSFAQWLSTVGRYGEPTSFISSFSYEIKNIIEQFTVSNNDLVKALKKADKENISSSVISFVTQEYELRVLEVMYKTLKCPKNAMLANDGIMILKAHPYDLTAIKQQILLQTGFNLELKVKEMTEAIDNIEVAEGSFTAMAKEFEKRHFLIEAQGIYVRLAQDPKDPSFEILSYDKMFNCYKQMACDCPKGGEPIQFIKKWANTNNDIRMYRDFDMVPPPLKCPADIYNLWQPFAMDLVPEYTPDTEGLDFILNHIKILCNHDTVVYEYFIRWIGQMFKFPAVKTTCPIFISDEGAGKGAFMQVMEAMMGSHKYLESTNPKRDVWGQFNDLMANSFFVHISEAGKSQTKDNLGEIKGLITDKSISINPKGKTPYIINSFHRVLFNTNNNNPIDTKENDRRNIIIRCSDELLKSNMSIEAHSKYFSTLRSLIQSIDTLKTCFEFFISLDGLDTFNDLPIPTTSHQTALKESNRSIVNLFIEHFTLQHYKPTICESMKNASSSALYTQFSQWKDANGFNYDMNSKKFGLDLIFEFDKYGVTQGDRKSSGNTKNFDFVALAKYFKIGEIII
jgi:hypothetical protein